MLYAGIPGDPKALLSVIYNWELRRRLFDVSRFIGMKSRNVSTATESTTKEISAKSACKLLST